MGAWIEIKNFAYTPLIIESLLAWERGLKSDLCHLLRQKTQSLLAWERGLKLLYFDDYNNYQRRSLRGSVD